MGFTISLDVKKKCWSVKNELHNVKKPFPGELHGVALSHAQILNEKPKELIWFDAAIYS